MAVPAEPRQLSWSLWPATKTWTKEGCVLHTLKL